MQKLLAAILACSALAAPLPLTAQSVLEGEFDPAIPTLENTIGHTTGTRITAPNEIVRYLEALHRAAPDRTRLVEYARSWEGRPLYYLVISSAANMARADENQAAMATAAAGRGLASGTLPVSWLSYGVHGNEISSSDAGLALAYHLLAGSDERTRTILAGSYVVIDPSQNPDGRNRFVTGFRAALGLEPSGDRYTAEHDEPWPGGRFNHYLFDLNRDWFALTQPETRGKVQAVRAWNPVVYVDAHEMGGDSTYFFPPSAEPFNPNVTAAQKAKQVLLGRNIARWFDELGIAYFNREVFDLFYPGYGDSWPTLNGAIGVTFEQASARGLVWDRRDGSTLTYAEGVRNHFIATLSYAETVARNADTFLADYAAFRSGAIADKPGGAYVIDLSKRRWNGEALGRRLALQGIVVERVGSGNLCGKSYPAGALVVPRAQPAGRLVRSLLDRNTPLDPAFIRKQEARRTADQPHELYDTTAWSVGLMSGVDVAVCGAAPRGTALAADEALPDRAGLPGRYGLVVPWTDSGQAQLVMAALREGLAASASEKPFTLGGRNFPRGSVVFTRAGNAADALDRLVSLARSIGAETVPVDDSWVEDGPSLGSETVARLAAPRVAMVWDDGVNPTSAGALRYVLERRLATPVAPIRTRTLARAALGGYDVLVVPEARLSSEARAAVHGFVKQGGTAVVVGAALENFLEGDSALFATRIETRLGNEPVDAKQDEETKGPVAGTEITSAGQYRAAIANPTSLPDTLPGALLNTVVEADSYLSSGYEGGPVVSADGSTILQPLNAKDGINVLRFAGPAELVASGHVWDENRRQMAFKPYMMAQPTGKGIAIGFTHDPAQRGYLDGLDLLIANAILFAPARTR